MLEAIWMKKSDQTLHGESKTNLAEQAEVPLLKTGPSSLGPISDGQTAVLVREAPSTAFRRSRAAKSYSRRREAGRKWPPCSNSSRRRRHRYPVKPQVSALPAKPTLYR